MIDFIKDADCTKETPVKLGVPDAPIYGKGIKLKPRVDGRTDSEHFKKIYLPELLPLEEYDLIVVLISGGKDSVACYLKLLELGVPKERIEFWHHDIDGGHPSRRMDWKCTQNYVKALADAEGIKLRVSYRVNGFFGELYRIGASEPIEWIDPDTGEVKQCKLSSNYLKCKAGWKGLCRKCMTLIFVLVAYRLDLVIGTNYIRDAVIIAFIANETISLVENAGLMGLPLPEVITKAIDILQKKTESEDK